jgi:probable HAF family extracellular repeat protein
MNLLPVLIGDSALGKPSRPSQTKEENSMNSRTWMWMAAASLLFAALAVPAQARVVYTPVNVSLPLNGYYAIDLNHDGITDITFQVSVTYRGCGFPPAFRYKLYVQPSPAGGIVGGNWASALQSGVQIDSHQTFYGGDDLMYDVKAPHPGCSDYPFHSWGYWVAVYQHYLGLEFQINGQTHYGWAELSTQGQYGVAYLHGFAYETIPFKGILTGQTMDSPSEPGIGPGQAESEDSGPTASVAMPTSDSPQLQPSRDNGPAAMSAQDQQQLKQQPRYTVTDLGTLGGTFAAAEGLNNRGWVDGISNLAGDQTQRAFLWRNGVMTDLGTLGGPNSSAFYSPNETGQVVGNAETLTLDPLGEDICGYGDHLVCLPYLWQQGVMSPLPTTLGGSNGYAHVINNRGQIVGSAENSTHDPNCIPPQVLDFEPVIWESKHGTVEITQLSLPPGDTAGDALWINDNGQAVGITGTCTTNVHGVLWQNGMVRDLGNLGGTMNTIPFAINSRGQAVGSSDLPGDTNFHAFLWQHGVMADLGTLPGDVSSVAYGIANEGQMVGTSYDSNGNSRAFLLQRGMMTDLNTLISASSPLFLLDGNGINSRGEIAGDALEVSTGEVHAYLATPCDGEGNDRNGCEDGTEGTNIAVSAASDNPKITLPENVRNLIRQQPARRYHLRGQTGIPSN